MIVEHLWIVVSLASNLKRRLLFTADWDELISAGNLSLVKAARRYEGRNGCQFKTYAYKFVRGDMLKSFTRIDGHHDSGLIQWRELEDYSYPAPQETDFYQKERKQRLATVMDRLPDHQKLALLTYINGGSLVGLARDLGHKRDKVMKWQRTAIKHVCNASAGLR